MSVLNFVMTDAGIAAAIAADSAGVEVAITHIGFGSAAYNPVSSRTALTTEIARVTISGGLRVSPSQIRIIAVWQAPTGMYDINEIGIYAGSTLFAVWSRATGGPVATKAPDVDFVFKYEVTLSGIPDASVNITVDAGNDIGVQQLLEHEELGNPHSQYLLATTYAAHLAAADPHPQYVLESAFNGANQNLAVPGFQNIFGGLELRFATATISGGGSTSITWNQPFSTVCFGVLVTPNDTFLSGTPPTVTAHSTTGATLDCVSGTDTPTVFIVGFGK